MKSINSLLLTEKEKIELLTIKTFKNDLSNNFLLSPDELNDIKQINKPSMQLGYAVQLLFLKNLGRKIPLNIKEIPHEIIDFVAEQLEIKYVNFKLYLEIETTRKRHFRKISSELKFAKFQLTDQILKIADSLTYRLASNKEMVSKFLEKLKELKILAPGLSTIEEVLGNSLKISESKIYEGVLEQLKNRENLMKLFETDEKDESLYTQLKNTTVNVSSNGAKELLAKIKMIDELGCNCDLSFLSENKSLYFSSDIQKSNRTRIMRFSDIDKRDAYLAMFLHYRRKSFVDMVIEVTSSYAHKVLKRSRKKTQKHNALNFQNYRNNSNKLKDILRDIIEIEELDEFKQYKDSLLSLKQELDSQEDEMDDVDFLIKSHHSFNYTNELLEYIKFDSNTKPELVKLLNSFSAYKNKKKLEVSIGFFSSQWQRYIKKYDYSKKIVEIALLYAVRDNIRSGDLFVRESGKYNSFDHYLLEPLEIGGDEESIKFFNEIKNSFRLPKKLDFNLEIDKDEKSSFSEKIYSYFPKITMTEMIYEVNSWTNFLDDFKEILQSGVSEKQKTIVATLLANGHNIGFSKMAISSSIDESTLRRTNEYYFNYNTLSKAQVTLVNYHHSLDIAKNWGDGEKSSSDGMRVPINTKTIYADYNPHYGNRGGAIYRHISDQYTPYYVQMLQGRDSNHVLDGLLYHGTDLDIYEHSTDTAGYTEQMFALTYLLGFKFKPRIKNSEQQQLYFFENTEIGNIKFKKINEKVIIENYQEIMRLVESIRVGKVKASLILQKIGSYARDNSIAKGLKELGRIFKTMYLLDYFSDKILRKEVQQILNKGESINSVGRILHFGKHGRISETTIEEQLEKASSLNILLGVLIIWNSRYLEKVYKAVKDEEWFDKIQFKRVSPLGTVHANFLGKYVFENERIVGEDGLRPLKIRN
ncbi:MAG: Tn3 family transposase [Cetobacterium sp.]